MTNTNGVYIDPNSVLDTTEKFRTACSQFEDTVSQLYGAVNYAKESGWQSDEANTYYDLIQTTHKATLDRILSELKAWEQQTQKIYNNFAEASQTTKQGLNTLN